MMEAVEDLSENKVQLNTHTHTHIDTHTHTHMKREKVETHARENTWIQ